MIPAIRAHPSASRASCRRPAGVIALGNRLARIAPRHGAGMRTGGR